MFDFELTEEDMEIINDFNKEERIGLDLDKTIAKNYLNIIQYMV